MQDGLARSTSPLRAITTSPGPSSSPNASPLRGSTLTTSSSSLSWGTGDTGIAPRKGGPKETRINKVKLLPTGRYFEAAKARGEEQPVDLDELHTIRVNNLFKTSNEQLRAIFEEYGQIADVYRPFNKCTRKPLGFVFVRFVDKEDMVNAMLNLNGTVVNGRPMEVVEAKCNFELDTSIY